MSRHVTHQLAKRDPEKNSNRFHNPQPPTTHTLLPTTPTLHHNGRHYRDHHSRRRHQLPQACASLSPPRMISSSSLRPLPLLGPFRLWSSTLTPFSRPSFAHRETPLASTTTVTSRTDPSSTLPETETRLSSPPSVSVELSRSVRALPFQSLSLF